MLIACGSSNQTSLELHNQNLVRKVKSSVLFKHM